MIPERIKHLSSRNSWNLIHRKHIQLCVPSSERVDDRLVLYGVQERDEGAPFSQAVDLKPVRRRADFEQDIGGGVEFFFGH